MFQYLSRWFRRRPLDPRSRRLRPPPRLESLEQRLAPAATHFAVIGDYGSAGPQEAGVAALVKSWSPDAVLTVGDNNYETGSAATIDANVGQYYHSFIGNYTGTYGAGSAVDRFFPTLGNHDWQTRSGTPALPTPYLNYFALPGNERYYTFTQGPVQFFAVDSGDGSGTGSDGFDPDGYTVNSVQGQWLKSQLAASTAPWKVVYFHHPPFSSGALGDDVSMQLPFQAWGATAVITGHDHDYERLNIGGFPYFVDGLGGEPPEPFTFGTVVPGSQVRYNSDNGALRVDATDTGIQFQFITSGGAVIDSYAIGSLNAPGAPSTPALVASSDTGLKNNDNITKISTPTFTGTAGSGNTVKVYSDGALVGSGTAVNGVYTITTSTLGDGTHGITATATDSAGNTSPASGARSVTIDTTAPTATIAAVSPNPRTTSVGQITIAFGEAVSGLALANLSLTRDGGANLLTGSRTLTTSDNVTWTLGNLAGLTGALGNYTLALTAAGSGVTDTAGNALAINASNAWQVVPAAFVQIMDNGASGTATVGSWPLTTGRGFRSDYLTATAGTGSKYATWTFTGLVPGQYRVSATWLAASNRATNAPYTVLQGSTILGSVAVNQRLAPSGFTDAGGTWQDLGGPYQITGTSLVVRLTNAANGAVVADGMRIELLPPVQTAAGANATVTSVASTSLAGVDGVAASLARWLAEIATRGVSLPASMEQRPPAPGVSEAGTVPGSSSDQAVRRGQLLDAILHWLAEADTAGGALAPSEAEADLVWVYGFGTPLRNGHPRK